MVQEDRNGCVLVVWQRRATAAPPSPREVPGPGRPEAVFSFVFPFLCFFHLYLGVGFGEEKGKPLYDGMVTAGDAGRGYDLRKN